MEMSLKNHTLCEVPPPPPKKKKSVNFHHAVFFLLDFLTSEAGIDRLSLNVRMELPLYAMEYLRRVQITHDLVMQALVWLCMVWFSKI
jgi:hypothetical protein